MILTLFLILSTAELKSRDCHISCLTKGYNGGSYDAKLDDCLCYDRYDYQDCMDPIRLPASTSKNPYSDFYDF
jgi:hypothetical protein